MPLAAGMLAVPVPSIHELFCSRATPKSPGATLLYNALLCGEDESCSETDWTDQPPTPYCASNADPIIIIRQIPCRSFRDKCIRRRRRGVDAAKTQRLPSRSKEAKNREKQGF